MLINGMFAGPFRAYQGVQALAVAPGWVPWWVSQVPGAGAAPYRRPVYRSETGRARLGESCQVYGTPWGVHLAGLYQQVRVTPGQGLRFTCWGYAWSSEGDDPSRSHNPGQMHLRVGIDPAGGTDPLAPSVVWSEMREVYDHFEAFEAEAVARSPVVTVFVYSRPRWPKKHNDIYWDDARLSVLGEAVSKLAPGAAGAEPDEDIVFPAALLVEAPGRFVNRTVEVRATSARQLEGAVLRIYGPYGEVQADWFGVEPGGRGYVWQWTFVPRKAGHYVVRFVGRGIAPVETGLYVLEALDAPLAEAARPPGAPREPYERTYILLPQEAGRPWLRAVVEGGILDDGRHTLGFSADDAGVGALDVRRVLVVNPDWWDEPAEWWFARHYPGVQVCTLSAKTPADLKTALRAGMGRMWD